MCENLEEIVEKVWYSINLHKMFGFSLMSKTEISFLPKSYIKSLSSIEIQENWLFLPLCLQQDSELQMHKPCPGHIERNERCLTDENDGPPLKQINCEKCLNKY